MSSTDSPGNTQKESSCSLVTSLFPSSCRGRAEAFAKSLHSRLSSLGSDSTNTEDVSQLPKNTWLAPTSTLKTTEPTSSNLQPPNHLDLQHARLSNSPETDLYYEVAESDEDEDTVGSPIEEADNTELNKYLSMSQNEKIRKVSEVKDEVYFDPLSSDSEKKSDKFFDPINNSDSEISVRVLNLGDSVPNRISSDESESSYQIPKLHLDYSQKSSTDTTPSHESLWSDDSTLSVPDSPLRLNLYLNARIIKSYSDSQIFIHVDEKLGGLREGESNIVDKSLSENDVSKVVNSDSSSRCDKPHKLEALNLINFRIQRTKTTESPDGPQLTNNLVDDLNQLSKLFGTFNGNHSGSEADLNSDLSHTASEMISSFENEILEQSLDDEEDEPPPRVRRCSSLKSGKTPPSTPCRKKIVRFADVLGLDLADVRTFLDEIPKIPNSAYSDLIVDEAFAKDSSPVQDTQWSAKIEGQRPNQTLIPLFQQPGSLTTFLDRLRLKYVCLENALVKDYEMFCIVGTVRVLNMDFHKSVHVRYSLNSWTNYSDLQATYVPNSCDGLSDKFSFILYCHTLTVGQKLEFAVRFQCKGTQYWDNNNGANYCFQCMPVTPGTNYTPNKGPAPKEWEIMFY